MQPKRISIPCGAIRCAVFTQLPLSVSIFQFLVVRLDESVGAPKNIHYQEWVNTGRADVNIPQNDLGNIDVKFETTDVKISFLISDFNNHSVDVKSVHNSLKNIMLKNVVRIRSTYSGATNEVVCLGGYEPSAVVVSRPAGANYIQGVFTMKKLNSENI